MEQVKDTKLNKILTWFTDNLTAVVLVMLFIPVFVWSQTDGEAVNIIGITSMEYMNNEFYGWFTCVFYHYTYDHIILNSAALICVGSLINTYTGRIRTAVIFLLGGALAEVPFSIIYLSPAYILGISSRPASLQMPRRHAQQGHIHNHK